MKVREIIRLIERDGWDHVRTTGSHPGTVTVAGKPPVNVPPKTLASVLRQAGLKER